MEFYTPTLIKFMLGLIQVQPEKYVEVMDLLDELDTSNPNEKAEE